jgi:formate dehydrogenase subunit gamma
MVSRTAGSYTAWSKERALEIVEKHAGERGPLMPILHDLQDVFGYVDPRAVEVLAEALNLSRADVHGVVSFYKDFRTELPGSSVIRVCRGEACQSMGAEQLARYARAQLEVDFGGTTSDDAITLEQVFCLGNCALSPAVMVDGRLKGRVDEARFDDLVADVKSQAL